MELKETKEFLRVDGCEEDTLISSLIVTAQELVEEVIRKKLDEFDEVPETIRQAMLILVGTLYEERQISKRKDGVDIAETLDLVRRMLFAYRGEKF
ncbi:MAG: phage gp6-like head-tail connector protein [Clostridia bacterium]|nr:phage gp6-like head-tail connector protein [Clostridia bacterium]